MSKLSREFVDERLLPLKHSPAIWDLKAVGDAYTMDLRMCFIRHLKFEFKWGDDSVPVPTTLPIIEQPSRIYKIDISLNDIKILDAECLEPFKGCRSLNASINQIESYPGVASLILLVQLDLCFNFITDLEYLRHSKNLKELRISHNHITSLSTMPLLSKLSYLYIDDNGLENLDGINCLPMLKTLSARKNRIKNITALSTCRKLVALDLSSNNLNDLEHITNNLTPISTLKELTLAGNPIAKDSHYDSTLKTFFKLTMIDGVPVTPEEEKVKQRIKQGDSDIEIFREVAKKTFFDRIRVSRLTMEENIRHLQKRIIAMQEDQTALEKKLYSELDATMQHIDFLDTQTMENFRHLNRQPEAYAYHPRTYYKTKEEIKRSENTDPDEVLRLASLKLAKEIRHNIEPENRPPVPHFHPTLNPYDDDPFQ